MGGTFISLWFSQKLSYNQTSFWEQWSRPLQVWGSSALASLVRPVCHSTFLNNIKSVLSLQLVSQPRVTKISPDTSFKLKQTVCTAYQPYWNAPKHTAADSLFLIMDHCMCRLHWSVICRWVVKTLKIPQCPLGGVQWMESSPSASFTVINGDGDNRSFIRRSGAVCVSTGSRSHSHTEDPFSLWWLARCESVWAQTARNELFYTLQLPPLKKKRKKKSFCFVMLMQRQLFWLLRRSWTRRSDFGTEHCCTGGIAGVPRDDNLL